MKTQHSQKWQYKYINKIRVFFFLFFFFKERFAERLWCFTRAGLPQRVDRQDFLTENIWNCLLKDKWEESWRNEWKWQSKALCSSMDYSLPWDSPGKNTGAGCHFLLRGSSSLRNQTHISNVSCIGKWFFFFFFFFLPLAPPGKWQGKSRKLQSWS